MSTKPVWSGDWPIPVVVPLPGLRVRIRLVPQDECLKRVGAICGGFAYAPPEAPEYTGKPGAAIYLNESLPLAVQRYTLLHELQHAATELLDVMLERFADHVHTNREARERAAKEAECPTSTPSSLPSSADSPLTS